MDNSNRTKCKDEKKVKKREKDRRYYYRHREDILKKQSKYQHSKKKYSDEELLEKGKDSFGRFIKTNGGQRYKIKQKNGKRKGEHVLVWEEHNKKELPKGWVVHHINGKKKDNNINNLEAMTPEKHNRIHFCGKEPWNKGIKCPNISKKLKGHGVTKEQITKCKGSWFNKYLDSNINIWKLKDKGKTTKQISDELNLTIDQVAHRWKGFNKVIDVNSGRLK